MEKEPLGLESPILLDKEVVFSEIKKFYKETDWNKIWLDEKDYLQRIVKEVKYKLPILAKMKEFDTERFNQEKDLHISDQDWGYCAELLEEEENHPSGFLEIAALLKTIDPVQFDQKIKISDKLWTDIINKIEEMRSFPHVFADLYAAASKLNAKRVKEQIKIDKKYWEEIKKEVLKNIIMFQDGARIKDLLTILPEGYSKIKVSPHTWHILKSTILRGICRTEFISENLLFKAANDIKELAR